MAGSFVVRRRFNVTGGIAQDVAQAVAVARDPPIRPLDERPDERKVRGDGKWSQDANVPSDPDPRRPSVAPTAVRVADMQGLEQDIFGWGVDDFIRVLKWQQVEPAIAVQSTKSPSGASADAAVSVIEHEQATVGPGGHGVSAVVHTDLNVLQVNSKYLG